MSNSITDTLSKLGKVTLFLGQVLRASGPALLRPRLIAQQVYNCGARSLVIIMLCGLFVGMVLGLQGYDLLARFGSESALGVAATLGLLKELGPVVTALLFAGKQYVLRIAGYSPSDKFEVEWAKSELSSISAVPLPGAVWLFGSALVGFMFASNRRKV